MSLQEATAKISGCVIERIMQSKKICYFITEDWYFYTHRLELAKAALDQGYEVSVMANDGYYREKIIATGLKWLSVDIVRRGWNPIKELKVILSVYKHYKTLQPNLVQHVAIKPIVYGTIAAKLARVPAIINTFGGMGWVFSDHWRAVIPRWFMRIIFRYLLRNTKIIVQHQHDRKCYLDMGLQDVSLIRGAGVNVTKFNSIPKSQEAPLIILVARLLWDKGVGIFVQAAELLRQQGVNARFALVGWPDQQNPASVSHDQLQKWHASSSVEVWGHCHDMVRVYAKAAIVCLPTHYPEGVPKSLLEAAACHLPIVTTDIPGCREIVVNNKNGFLVPTRDPTALCHALSKLLESPTMRVQFGQFGRQLVVQHFSSEIINQQTLQLYHRMLE